MEVTQGCCYSREQAQALVTSIDCVIGMKESIHDDAATVFASSFYRAIGFGRSIQEAFDQGKTALLLEGIPEEDIPELLIKDGVDPNQVVLIGHQAGLGKFTIQNNAPVQGQTIGDHNTITQQFGELPKA